MPSFHNLFQTIDISHLGIRNRLVMPAMLTNFCDRQGFVNDRHLAYYRRRAQGGVGLIIVEPSFVHPRGRIRNEQLSLCDEAALPGLQRLVKAIQNHGSRAAIQLHHGGRNARSVVTGSQPLGASPIPTPGLEKPREIIPQELNEVVGAFSRAADLGRQAGFDALEISATTGGILGQFLSPAANTRGDEYGSSFENRSRPLLAVIKAIQAEVGSRFPLICRINSREDPSVESGLTLEDGKLIAASLELAGIHAIHVYVDYDGAPQPLDQRPLENAALLHLTHEIKKTVRIPVIAVGRMDPLSADKALCTKKADMVAMGKALIADPDLPNKISAGRLSAVRPCIVCLRCIDNVRTDKILECTVNARVGHEVEPAAVDTDHPKSVLVIGGGPAGMEAARMAALRGHRVSLCEKSSRLGGLMLLGAILNPDLIELKDHLIRELRSSPARVALNREVDPDFIKKLNPEVVVVATGGIPAEHAYSENTGEIMLNLKNFLDLLNGKTPSGVSQVKRVLWCLAAWAFRYAYHPRLLRCLMPANFPVGKRLVIIGGQFAGGELGLAYAQKGKVVVIMEEKAEFLSDLGPTMKAIYLAKLKKHQVALLKEIRILDISKNGVHISLAGSKQLINADSVVMAGGLKKNPTMIPYLQNFPGQVHLIGDCIQPARIKEAIAAGYRVGAGL
jgi:2,4-dienoyl-CoA reductase-like NADH-dependent reductase (Old Yellow Enzyme family)